MNNPVTWVSNGNGSGYTTISENIENNAGGELYSDGANVRYTSTAGFKAGDVIRIRAKYNDSRNGALVLSSATSGVTFSSGAVLANAFSSASFVDATYTIPAGTPTFTTLNVTGATSNGFYGQIDVVSSTRNECINFTNNVFVDANNNGIKDAGEDIAAISSTLYVNLVQGGVVVQSFPITAVTGIGNAVNVSNGTYQAVLSTSPTSTTAILPLGTSSTAASQTITVTNGAVNANNALYFPLIFADTDNDSILDINDLDDDNDGILDTEEMVNSCSSLVQTPSSVSTSPGGYFGAILMINNSGMTGSGLTATSVVPADGGNSEYLADGATTATITFDFTSNPSISKVALWAPPVSTATIGGDAPIRDFKVKVTYNSGLTFTSSTTYRTAQPTSYSSLANAQIFDLGQTFANVTKIELLVENGWYNGVNASTSVTGSWVPTNSTSIAGKYNLTLSEFRGVCESFVDMDTDNDGIPNRLDLDSDGDGCPDSREAGIKDSLLQDGTLPDGNPAASKTFALGQAKNPYGANGLSNGLENNDAPTATVNTSSYNTGASTYAPKALDATLSVCCKAGYDAPTLSTTAIINTCPATTVDLTTITSSNTPANTVLEWHNATPAAIGNKVLTPTAVTAGTYYAVFYDSANTCYSNTTGTAGSTKVTVSISPCCAAGYEEPIIH